VAYSESLLESSRKRPFLFYFLLYRQDAKQSISWLFCFFISPSLSTLPSDTDGGWKFSVRGARPWPLKWHPRGLSSRARVALSPFWVPSVSFKLLCTSRFSKMCRTFFWLSQREVEMNRGARACASAFFGAKHTQTHLDYCYIYFLSRLQLWKIFVRAVILNTCHRLVYCQEVDSPFE